MDTGHFQQGDKCTLRISWGDGSHRGKRVQIVGFQQNGREIFAKIIWCSVKARVLEKQYGNLFNLDELKKIS